MRSLYEIRVGVYATEADVARVVDGIERLLCPDPEHAPPCPVPWSIGLGDPDEDAYPELLEQAAIEDRSTGA